MGKLILILAVLALVIYYVLALLQYIGLFRFTKRKITFFRTLIPFYYLF